MLNRAEKCNKRLCAPKEHLLKPTLRLPHRTNARKLDAPVCGTHGGTFMRWGIRVTAVGEERRAFIANFNHKCTFQTFAEKPQTRKKTQNLEKPLESALACRRCKALQQALLLYPFTKREREVR